MLLGRAGECGTIERVLASAREDAAAVLVLRGPVGVGKTALLEWAVEAEPSMTSIIARIAETEQRFRWSALRTLVKPLERDLAGLPQSQVDVLAGVLSGTVATDDPRALGASLVALFSVAARTRPLLVVIDDAHWLDQGSQDALMFVARRIDYEPVALLFAVDADRAPESFSEPLPVLEVPGLSPIDAVTLLADQVETKVAEELARMTQGNPLAMREIAEQLDPAQRTGAAPIGSVPALGEVLVRGFNRHADGLSDAQRLLLIVAAAEPGLERATFGAAARAAGLDSSAVETVVKPGLLVAAADGGIRFAHPLVRDVVYQRARPADRRRAHRALAAAFREDAESDRTAWHLAAGADGHDPVASRALEELGTRANNRGDAHTAGAAFLRAAELSEERGDQVRRFTAAGNAFSLGDLNQQAVDAFERALRLADDPKDQADIQIARAGPRLVAPGSSRGFGDLADLAAAMEPVDAVRASALYGLAALNAITAGEIAQARLLCRKAVDGNPDGTGRSAKMAAALWALLMALSGDCADASRELLQFNEPDRDLWLGRSTLIFEDLVAEALKWVGELSASSRLVAALVEQSREANAIAMLARALVVRADLYSRTGYWDAALADGNESLGFAIGVRAPATAAFALAVVTRVEAGLGRVAEARRDGLEALATARASGLAVNEFWSRGALGFLALVQGNGVEALAHLEAARAFAAREGIDVLVAVPWAPDLVESYVRVGRMADARQVVAELDDQAVGAQGALAEALLERCHGLVADEEPDRSYRAAIEAHSRVLAPFERARTLLSYGERLRRDRRPADAIPILEEAAALFEDLGAAPWSERAGAELVAHGRPSASTPRRRDALTPQEFRVARAVADGATNREAAAALFLSPRTVEHHLMNVYRKLGVRSRSELARRVTTDPDLTIRLDH